MRQKYYKESLLEKIWDIIVTYIIHPPLRLLLKIKKIEELLDHFVYRPASILAGLGGKKTKIQEIYYWILKKLVGLTLNTDYSRKERLEFKKNESRNSVS